MCSCVFSFNTRQKDEEKKDEEKQKDEEKEVTTGPLNANVCSFQCIYRSIRTRFDSSILRIQY